MVDGTGSSRPAAIPRMVLRRILPERVFGSAGTTATSRNEATAPIWSRTSATSSARSVSGSVAAPALSTTNPRGTWPFSSSGTPITAHSATAGWLARLDRHRFQAAQVGRDRPAGLGLPPVVDDRDAELVGRPVVGLRVQPLAGQEQVPQPGQVVPADVLAGRVLPADRAERGRRG